jgi:hypothetical protein
MLLSLPTWIVHLLSVTEWFAAMVLFERYGRLIRRQELRLFALCMTPHLLGGACILWFHFGGDIEPRLLDAARALNFCGSLLLLSAALAMALRCKGARTRPAWFIVLLGVAWGGVQLLMTPDPSAALLRGTNLFYLLFLMTLVWLDRVDRSLFSRLTIGGFWFLLVFVAVTIFNTWVATQQNGLPSLSHDDVRHGLSESLLSLSNLMVALGAYSQIKRARGGSLPGKPGIVPL